MLLNTSSNAIIAVLAFLAGSVQAHQIVLGPGSNEHSPFNDAFDEHVEGLLEEWHVPGLAIAVVHENHTWSKGYGYASLPDEPVTPHTLFQGASTTKSFTASLAALLVDNDTIYKNVDWSTPLHSLVGNEFVLSDPYLTEHVTLHDALSHRTGLPRHEAVWVNNDIDVAGEVHALRYLPVSAPFRTKWQYCNLMFTAVSHVIQTLTGKWQGAVLREWLWEPLGMDQSYYSYDDAHTCEATEPTCKVATSYAWNNESREFDAIAEKSFHAANGAGGIISNVIDYSKWVHALMYEAGPVSKAGHESIKSPLSIESTEKYPYSGPMWYGTGLEGGIYRGEKVFGHGGAIGGYFSHFAFLPDKKFGFIAFANAEGNVADIAGFRLIDEFLTTPTEEMAKMNERYREEESKELEKRQALPSILYPDVPSHPLKPQLDLEAYTGSYHHPAYGFVNATLTPPATAVLHDAPIKGAIKEALYMMSRHENILYTLRHVNGEHWLLEQRSHVHSGKIADAYSKVKFEVGSDGRVDGVRVVIQDGIEVDGGYAWFKRVGGGEKKDIILNTTDDVFCNVIQGLPCGLEI